MDIYIEDQTAEIQEIIEQFRINNPEHAKDDIIIEHVGSRVVFYPRSNPVNKVECFCSEGQWVTR